MALRKHSLVFPNIRTTRNDRDLNPSIFPMSFNRCFLIFDGLHKSIGWAIMANDTTLVKECNPKLLTIAFYCKYWIIDCVFAQIL